MSYTSLNSLTFMALPSGAMSMHRDPKKTLQFYKNNSGNFAFEGNPDSDEGNTSIRNIVTPNVLYGLDNVEGAYSTPLNHAEIEHDGVRYYIRIETNSEGERICKEVWAKYGKNSFKEIEVLSLPEDHPGITFFAKRVSVKN